MREFPKHESDEIDRKNIRDNLDQYSQIDHDQDANKFIEYMSAVKSTQEAMDPDTERYDLLESFKGFDIEKTAEEMINYMKSRDMLNYMECRNLDELSVLIKGFLDPEINEGANNYFGKCCDILNCRITIPSADGSTKDVEVENIIAKNSFLKHMKSVIKLQDELNCEIPSLIRFRVNDGELFLKEIKTYANKENTIVVKDSCFKELKENEEKTPPQQILDILSEYINKKDKESTKKELSGFTKTELVNALDSKYYTDQYTEMLKDDENKELSIIDQILKTDKAQVSSKGHCRISDKIRNELNTNKFILLHTHPTETTISSADSKHGYSLMLRVGDRLIKSQVIASSNGDEFSIYFKDQYNHRKIKVKSGDIYRPGEISLQLFDIMIASIKTK